MPSQAQSDEGHLRRSGRPPIIGGLLGNIEPSPGDLQMRVGASTDSLLAPVDLHPGLHSLAHERVTSRLEVL